MRGFHAFFRGVQVSLIKNWYPEIGNNISKAVACPVSTGEKKNEDILIRTFPKFSHSHHLFFLFIFKINRIDVYFRLILVAKTSFGVCVSNDCATAVLQKWLSCGCSIPSKLKIFFQEKLISFSHNFFSIQYFFHLCSFQFITFSIVHPLLFSLCITSFPGSAICYKNSMKQP